MHTYILMCI